MRARPRVLHVIGSLDIGGAEKQIVEIVRGLAGRFEFHVGLLSSGGPLEPLVRAEGAEIHPLASRGAASPAHRLWRAARARSRLRSLLRGLDPDIIHSWLFEGSFLAALSRWPAHVPPLIVSRRSLVGWIARHPSYYPLARWTNGQADILLANAEAVRADVIRKERVESGRVQVIYNGVDTSVYTPGPADEKLRREAGLPEGLPVVGMVANIHTYKGHGEVVEAVAALRDEGFRCALLFVGRDGDATVRLRERIDALGLENVVFAGARGDVPRMLRLMDVFVSASHEEGFSNSILEAMSSGRAIVTTSVGGSVEQIENGANGFVVPPHSPVSLAAAVARLLGDPSMREALGTAARKTAIGKFGLERVLEETAALYERLAPQSRGSGNSAGASGP
ncbi:MAG: glycosyltransferase [Thermoanaerobaculia bacterium]